MKAMPQPWRWIFRVFGLSPRGNRKDKYFTAIPLVMLLGMTSLTLLTYNKPITTPFRWLMGFLYLASAILFLLYNCLHPERCLGLERDLRKIDLELDNLCNVKCETSTVSKVIIIWAAIIGVLLPLVKSFILPLTVVAKLWLGNFFVYMPFLQLALLANLINNRFSVLNDRLASITIGPDTPYLLNQVFQIHSSLHALVADINFHFCFYSLLNFAGIFICSVQSMYFVLLFISGEIRDELSFYILIFRLMSSSGYFILLALVCHSCSLTGNRTVLIAHHLLQPDTDPSIWDQVRLFSALATDNKVHFTIGEIFTLDRTLVTKTALTALSYLIITVQLRDVKVFVGDSDHFNGTTVTPSTST